MYIRNICITYYGLSCRLAYADYIVAKLVEECKVPLEVNLLYDIGCMLISHWKVCSTYN